MPLPYFYLFLGGFTMYYNIMRSRLKTIVKGRYITVNNFSKISNINARTISFLNMGYYDKVSAYHLYKISSILKISADFIIRNSDMPYTIAETSIIKNIDRYKFQEYFDIDMKIDKLIELCKGCNMSIDQMFLFEYV